MSNRDFEIKTYGSIDKVPEEEWESLDTEGDIFYGRGFLNLLEKNHTVCYLTIKHKGESIAKCSFYNMTVNLLELVPYNKRKVARILFKLLNKKTIQKIAILGLPLSLPINNVKIKKQDSICQGIIISEFNKFSIKTNSKINIIHSFGKNDAFKCPRKYNVLYLINFVLKFNSYSSYLSTIRGTYLRHIKHSFKKDILHWDTFKGTFNNEHYKLYLNVFKKADSKFEKISKPFFDGLIRLGNFNTILAKDKYNPLAFFSFFYSKNKSYMFKVGLDYKFNRTYDLYFNLLNMYIRKTVGKESNLGYTSDYVKMRLGGVPEQRRIFFKINNPFWNIFAHCFTPIKPKLSNKLPRAYKNEVKG